MFKYLILLNALVLSGVAAYYSILGLMTIFAAAAIPVAIMGTSLEIGKLVTATFLHNHWKSINFFLKTYLTAAVVVLMVITSLGIFGLLSKANIDANLTVQQAYQRIEQIDRQVNKLEEEQKLSEEAYRNASKQNLDQSNDEIDLLTSQMRQAQNSLKLLETAVQLNDVRKIQTIVGVKVDGRYGPNTEKSVAAFKLNEENKINDLNGRIRLLNDRLQDQKIVIELVDNTDAVRTLTKERFVIEKEVSELEAEVGPIKYISELVYNSSEGNTMEEAVRWMIIVIVLVFDPLAISLLLAFNSLNQKGKRNAIENQKIDPKIVGKDQHWSDSRTSVREDSEEELDLWKKGVKEQPLNSVAPVGNIVPKKLEKRRGKMATARKQKK